MSRVGPPSPVAWVGLRARKYERILFFRRRRCRAVAQHLQDRICAHATCRSSLSEVGWGRI